MVRPLAGFDSMTAGVKGAMWHDVYTRLPVCPSVRLPDGRTAGLTYSPFN